MKKFFSHAKWILCGEHAVTQGAKAIVFPLQNFSTIVTFEEAEDFSISTSDESATSIVADLFERGAAFCGQPLSKICGKFFVTSDIPQKVGFGSSASICVNIAKVFQELKLCDDVFTLARHLEDKFHKKSSGLDIAAVINSNPIIFKENRVTEILKIDFQPKFLLTYCGETSSTSKCAEAVQKIWGKDSRLGVELDKKMDYASNTCEQALKTKNFQQLCDGINLSREIFQAWGLCNESLENHFSKLFSLGAVAAKPIGSGLGGYVLSLWKQIPTEDVDNKLTLPNYPLYYPLSTNGENNG